MFLTGRDNEVDKILGLEIGADDYITKPFNPRELTIRARNLLSRTMNLGTVSEERRSVESYKFNGWELDINSRSLIGPDGEQYKTTAQRVPRDASLLRKPWQNSVARRAVEENDRARAEAA